MLGPPMVWKVGQILEALFLLDEETWHAVLGSSCYVLCGMDGLCSTPGVLCR